MKRSTDQFREFSRRVNAELGKSITHGRAAMKKRWRRSWTGRVAWPWLVRELEIIGKVAGAITLSLWLKRLVEQFLEARVLNESILRGEMNDVVREIEEEVERRSKHGRRRK